MDRLAIHPLRTAGGGRARSVAVETRQSILDLRAWGESGVGPASTGGAIRATFTLAHATATVTMWVQSRAGFDVLTYRHFGAAAGPSRHWNLTFPGFPPGTYEVILDVPVPDGRGRESWMGEVEV